MKNIEQLRVVHMSVKKKFGNSVVHVGLRKFAIYYEKLKMKLTKLRLKKQFIIYHFSLLVWVRSSSHPIISVFQFRHPSIIKYFSIEMTYVLFIFYNIVFTVSILLSLLLFKSS